MSMYYPDTWGKYEGGGRSAPKLPVPGTSAQFLSRHV